MNFAIPLNPDAPLPMYRQIYEGLRRKILASKLAPGQRFPSTRTLSQHLGVSRNTVALSYAQLLSEGYFQAIIGSGTFVCQQIPEDLSSSLPNQSLKQHKRTLSTYGESLVDFDPFLPPDPTAPISFHYGRPALDEFPLAIWRQLLCCYCRANHDTLDYNPDLLGYKPLRQAIADYLERSRQVHCDPDPVVIVSGSQQVIDLAMHLMIQFDFPLEDSEVH